MENKKRVWLQRRRRVSEIVEAGSASDPGSRVYDVFSTLMTMINVTVTVMYTFDRMELGLPHGMIVAMIRRGNENIVPRGNVTLKTGDTLILGAESLKDDRHIDLKEVLLLKHNPWNGLRIRDLDISRQTIIVLVKRNDTVLVPKGDLVLLEGDRVILYSQERITGASTIQI